MDKYPRQFLSLKVINVMIKLKYNKKKTVPKSEFLRE